MQRRRNLAPGKLRITAFEHHARQLLDEQRYSASTLDDRRDGLVRQSNLRGDLRDHRTHVTRGETAEIDLRMMRPRRPWGVKLGARRVEQQQSRVRSLFDQQ